MRDPDRLAQFGNRPLLFAGYLAADIAQSPLQETETEPAINALKASRKILY
jgi:hypothetical protein